LLPAEEQDIRQHLAHCPECRARAADIQAVCIDLQSDLQHTLDHDAPAPKLSFDTIKEQWHEPPQRVTWTYKLQQLLPSASTAILLGLFVLAFLMLVPGSNADLLRNMSAIEDYDGPPAVIAAHTDEGLAVLRLAADGAYVTKHFDYLSSPRNLTLSPDGQWLALQQSHTLHIIETARTGTSIRVAVHDAADWAWSPDSRTLAYTDGEGRLALFDVTTQTNRIIVPAAENAWGMPVWSADGSQLAYATAYPLPVESSVQRQQSIWRVQPENGYRVELARNPAPDTTLLLPAAWVDGMAAILAWDLKAGIAGEYPALYRVDVARHQLTPVGALSVAQGPQLAWPVSAQGSTLGIDNDQLHLLDLAERTRQPILERMPWPDTMAWAPNSTWLAFTDTNRAEGAGLYVFAPDDRTLRQVRLPKGATEKAVYWADAEHLFVIRQQVASPVTELWLVSLTSGDAQRLITNVEAPLPDVYNGWRWQDVLAMQAIR